MSLHHVRLLWRVEHMLHMPLITQAELTMLDWQHDHDATDACHARLGGGGWVWGP
jgi:hypothetical protein